MVSFACFGSFGPSALMVYIVLSVVAIIPASLFAVVLKSTMDISLRRALSVETVAITVIAVLCAIFFGWFSLIFVLPGALASVFLTLLSYIIDRNLTHSI